MSVYTIHVYVILKNKHNSRLEAPRERHQQRSAERETSAEKRRERDISRDVCVRGILNVCVRGSTCMRQVGGDHAPGEVGSIHQFSVGYTLHAFVERITLSHRAYMQVHNQERQLIPSVRSKNVMQLERAPNRGSFIVGSTQKIPDLVCRAHHTVASGLHAVPQPRTPAYSLCEIQKCHVRSKNVMQLERQTETPALEQHALAVSQSIK